MKKIFFFLLILVLSVTYTKERYFPYYFPADPAKAPDYQGVPASTFNVGKYVLDAPAGKHGFVRARDGHFYFDDGIRAKFWGTNIAFNACFPDKKTAEIMANRIAYFGFNAVRLHHMDMLFEPDGIFEDVAPDCKNKQMKPTGHLSPGQLDKLDYLIFQLKQHGIYIDINTLVSRLFTEADGVPYAEELSAAGKPVSLFDAKLIKLQKQYDKDLLTHFNPYTKLRYSDDPAICLVEINNENSLTELNPLLLPKYYQKELNNLTNNGEIPLSELEKQYLKEMRDYLHNELKVKVPVGMGVKMPVGMGGNWTSKQLKIQQECLDYIDKHAYWDHPSFPHKKWDMNDFRIKNKSIFADKNLGIIGGSKVNEGESKQSNKPHVVSEWNHCYPNKYAFETPLLIAAEANKNDWDALFQFAFSQGGDGNTNYDNIKNYFDINSNAQQLILCAFGSWIFLRDGDTALKIEVTENCATVLIKKYNITVKVGKIKNTYSGWDANGKFRWGTSPTLMEKQ